MTDLWYRGRMDSRQTIKDALAMKGWNPNRLAKAMAAQGQCNRETVLRYLRGERDCSATLYGAMCDILGLRVSGRRRAKVT